MLGFGKYRSGKYRVGGSKHDRNKRDEKLRVCAGVSVINLEECEGFGSNEP